MEEASNGDKRQGNGCAVGENVLIGMGSIVMDNCVIADNCIIAAGAVLRENTHVKSGSVWAGVPAKKVKDLSPELSCPLYPSPSPRDRTRTRMPPSA